MPKLGVPTAYTGVLRSSGSRPFAHAGAHEGPVRLHPEPAQGALV